MIYNKTMKYQLYIDQVNESTDYTFMSSVLLLCDHSKLKIYDKKTVATPKSFLICSAPIIFTLIMLCGIDKMTEDLRQIDVTIWVMSIEFIDE